VRVLIVEDDGALAGALAIMLRSRGDEPVVARSGVEALELLAAANTDIVILDLGLPDMDGASVLEKLRAWSAVPVVVLSARHDAAQKVRALDLGANDYVTKPFNVDELLARIRAATRRVGATPDHGLVATASFTIDVPRRVVTRDGTEVAVTPTEWRLLELLAREPGVVVQRERLLESLRGPSVPHGSHYLRAYIQQLRAKLEPVPGAPRHLVTVAGVGYRLDV
jgi:two-component system KDP operon response regulator KdpE